MKRYLFGMALGLAILIASVALGYGQWRVWQLCHPDAPWWGMFFCE